MNDGKPAREDGNKGERIVNSIFNNNYARQKNKE
jgi:hypothetical protein